MIDKSNFRFLLDDPKDYIQREIVSGRFWEEEELLYLKTLNTAKWTILDIGAHIGNHTLFFSKFMDVDTIYVIEPLVESYKTLLCNIALNYCKNVNVDFLGFALSDKETFCKIKQKFIDNTGATQLEEDQNGDIPCAYGDLFFSDKKIDFIKLDVEQMEIKVLNGLKSTIATNRPLIFLELDRSNQKNLEEWMQHNNYQLLGQIGKHNNYLIGPNENSSIYNLQERN